jgi:hypothetical protein
VLWTMGDDSNEAMEHETRRGDEMQAGDGLGQAFVITGQAPKATGPGKGAFDYPAARQHDEAVLGVRQLGDLELDAVRFRCGRRSLARVALIDKGEFDAVAGRRLDGGCQRGDLIPFIGISRSHVQRQQGAERIDRKVNLGTLAPFVAVIPGAMPTFRRALYRAAVQNHGGRIVRPSFTPPQDRPQIVHHCLQQPAAIQRCVCWQTASHGGKLVGNKRHRAPARTI